MALSGSSSDYRASQGRHPSLEAFRASIVPSGVKAAIAGVVWAALAMGIAITLDASGVNFGDLIASSSISFVWLVCVFLVLGTPYLAIRTALRFEVAAGMVSAPDNRPGVRIYPAWWVRFIAAWIGWWCLVYGGGWLATLMRAWPLRVPGATDGMIGFGESWIITLAGALSWAALSGVIRLVEAAELRRIKSLWLVISAGMGVFLGGAFYALLGLVTLGANWMSVRVGLGSVWSMTTAIGLVPLAFAAAELGGRGFYWEHDDGPTPSRSRRWDPSDIRTWDFETETSHAGIGGNGYPYFIWRERADNRLGLSRPRFCTIIDDDTQLLFGFYNPVASSKPQRWPLLGVLLAIAIAVGMLAIDAIGPWLFGRGPFFSDPRAHALVHLATVGVLASLSATAFTSLAYIVITLARWYRTRFEADGQLITMPLSELSGFQASPAERLLAKGPREAVKTAEGLTAVFYDGTVWILTSNAWEPRTVGEYHKHLTNAFRTPRDQWLSAFDAKRKGHRPGLQADPVDAPSHGASEAGVPDKL